MAAGDYQLILESYENGLDSLTLQTDTIVITVLHLFQRNDPVPTSLTVTAGGTTVVSSIKYITSYSSNWDSYDIAVRQ